MPHGPNGEVQMLRWKVLQYKWSVEDHLTLRGLAPPGTRSWHEVDMHRSKALAFGHRGPY
ncbi:hypothetical protein Ddye_011918 [Dipteronia dyeriana]|uniref:Uncharacterized protein n=1 Tax=Dipteronia dyeriana TaxID=168575 RepID=A0AAE0CHW3_9ROSI|nr:hypothetical protein Ddye_011918 [Dipteronia dyeriana]